MRNSRIWVLGFVLIAVAVVALGWFLGVSPRLDEAAAANAQAESVALENEVQQQRLATLQQQSENLPQLESELDALQVSIPPMPNLHDFFDHVDAAAKKRDVAVTNLTAGQPEMFTPVDGDAAGAPAGLYTISISMTAEGAADRLVAFVRDLYLGDRLLLMSNAGFTRELENPIPQWTLSGYLYVLEDPRITVVNDGLVDENAPAPTEPPPAEEPPPADGE